MLLIKFTFTMIRLKLEGYTIDVKKVFVSRDISAKTFKVNLFMASLFYFLLFLRQTLGVFFVSPEWTLKQNAPYMLAFVSNPFAFFIFRTHKALRFLYPQCYRILKAN